MRISSKVLDTLQVLRPRSAPPITLLLLALTSACGDSPTEPGDAVIPWEKISSKIAYSVQRCDAGRCTQELLVIDAAARVVHSLETRTMGRAYEHLAWSPDASQIAYSTRPPLQSNRWPPDGSTITSIPASGGMPTHHYSVIGKNATYPAWSRDGRFGYWVSGFFETREIDSSRMSVWRNEVWVEGGPVYRGAAAESRFTWAPDTRHIVAVIGDSTTEWGLYRIDLESGSKTALLQGDRVHSERFSDPLFSPDGSRIVYRRSASAAAGSEVGAEIWTMAADGTDRRRLTSGGYYDSEPSWSPDGQKIAFRRSSRVFIMNADGSDVVHIAGNDDVVSVAWAP